MKKLLLIILIVGTLFVIAPRLAAHFFLPKPGATDVIIYTTEWCPYCKSLRQLLKKYEIPYQDYDTEKSLHGFVGYWALKGHGVPVAVIGEEVIHGYDGYTITEALVGAGYTIPSEWPQD